MEKSLLLISSLRSTSSLSFLSNYWRLMLFFFVRLSSGSYDPSEFKGCISIGSKCRDLNEGSSEEILKLFSKIYDLSLTDLLERPAIDLHFLLSSLKLCSGFSALV